MRRTDMSETEGGEILSNVSFSSKITDSQNY